MPVLHRLHGELGMCIRAESVMGVIGSGATAKIKRCWIIWCAIKWYCGVVHDASMIFLEVFVGITGDRAMPAALAAL